MRLFFKTQEAANFEDLVKLVPDTEFPHLTRSTVPLLAYWRQTERAASTLTAGIGLPDLAVGDIHFEYEVPAFGGNAPSCTDVMYVSESTAIAVEAKWTEPLYGTAAQWLTKRSNLQNRKNVLGHWAELIQRRTNAMQVDRIGEIEYQMLHRTASACASGRPNVALVFQMFGSSCLPANYMAALNLLAEITGEKSRIKIFAHCVPLLPSPEYTALAHAITGLTQHARAEAIRKAIERDELFQFDSDVFVPIAT